MSKGDYLTYRKATSTSLTGLVIQLILTLALFFYARISGDAGGGVASVFLLTGVLVWGVLLLVFDQHRRERIEAMEAEQLAVSGASAASAFERAEGEVNPAAQRLATMYKWIVPAAAIVLALVNIWFGFTRLRQFQAIEDYQNTTTHAGWALAIGIAMAVIGFVFARFVSGMAKVDAWANLRAGATTSVAAALVGLVLAVGGFLQLALSINLVIALSPYIITIGMMAYGAEIVLNLLLDIYRPRKPGELPRPAFDSRFLGLLAAPDRIAENVGEAVNYQFGVDVTSSWFYQLLSRWITAFIAIGVGIGWLMSSLVVVEPHERGLILTNGVISEPLVSFGQRGEGDIGPGLHIKWPWPFSTYETPVSVSGGDQQVRTTTGVRVLHLASNPPTNENTPILWTESHAGGTELLNIVQPEREVVTDEDIEGSNNVVAELSLVAAEVPVHYVVRNVKLFDQFAAPGQRERMLQQVGQRVVTQYLGERSLDEVLASYRTAMPIELKQRLEQAYSAFNDGQGAGIEILFVGINGVHPPTRVAPSFERVIAARQNRESLIEEARKQQISMLTDVAGSVDLAERISRELEELDAIRRDRGSDSDAYIESELRVQRLLEGAGGEAGELLLAATANRWVRHMSERGRASLLQGQQAAYLAAPELYRSKMYFDALSEAMRESRVYLTPAEIESLLVRLELQDEQAGRDVFDPEAGEASQ